MAPVVSLVDALACRRGIEGVLRDAHTGRDQLGASSEWYCALLAVEGLARMWTGDAADAEDLLERAAEFGERFAAPQGAISALASLAVLAARDGDHRRAGQMAGRAVRLVEATSAVGYATSVLPYAVAARVALHEGDIDGARRLVGRAHAHRPRLSRALPFLSVQALVELVEAEVGLADIPAARQAMREAVHIGAGFDLGGLSDRLGELRDLLAGMPTGHTGPAALTAAELRLLPLLTTHLSFPEIGERLFVSRHTVKTQAMSIYRKLGASTRSEAVAIAREMHLLDS